jgi:hypothetical protein
MPKKYLLPIILILPLIGISALYVAKNRSTSQTGTAPVITEVLTPTAATVPQNYQGTQSGQFINGQDISPDISVFVDGEEIQTFTIEELEELANVVPENLMVLEEQKYISITELLNKLNIDDYSQVTVSGHLGFEEKEMVYTRAEVEDIERLPTLVTTYVPSWKLVESEDDQVPIGNPSDLRLRIVKEIKAITNEK